MAQELRVFPHIPLRFVAEGRAKLSGGRSDPNRITQTKSNLDNRQAHGGILKNSVSSLVTDWQIAQKQRQEEEQLPPVEAITLILQVDPETFDLDDLRTSGIEILSELENGYIIGASADAELTEFQKKIDLFLNQQRGGGVVAKVLNILDRQQRPEFILSEDLLAKWDGIRDDQVYVVEVGVSCLGPKTRLTTYPDERKYQSAENYAKAITDWISNRNITYQEWDETASERQQQLIQFVESHQGKFLSSFEDGMTPQFSKVPDSFSCLIEISGKGLRDIVFNFPYLFEVVERDEIFQSLQPLEPLINEIKPVEEFKLISPSLDAPKVCIIDSGIQENHPSLVNAIDSNNSRSWVPLEINLTADLVSNGGHGTRVAGAVIYPRTIPRSGKYQAECWLQNARVLDNHCSLPQKLYPPQLLEGIVEFYYSRTNTRIFNHSIAGNFPCRLRYMSAWAATIDCLSYEKDILFIVAASNIPLNHHSSPARLSIRAHLTAGRAYPNYLTDNSCRIANPAQSLQALTVGSVTLNSYRDPDWSSLGEKDQPSPFSCSGPGIWDTIKPDVVEYGGDIVIDNNSPPTLKCSPTSPELVRSTLDSHPAPLIAADTFGTSFASPKVSYIAARLASEFPNESCLLYRALIVQSARWPSWADSKTNEEKLQILRQIGYGIPNLERAIANTPYRSTFITRGDERIRARDARIYQVQLPESLRLPDEEYEILVEITLSYKAQPRRTRRHGRKYLSTWLDWECSKQGEEPERFKERILETYNSPEDAEKGGELFNWTLGKEKRYKTLKGVSRSLGTLQKDWAVVNSYNFRQAFCIAVVGHEGWNNDPYAEVSFALVVSFEALRTNIPIYIPLAQAQVEVLVEPEFEVQVEIE
jgi:hypothetical protein